MTSCIHTTTDTPLSEFFDNVFAVERLRGKSAKYVETYSRAIQWLQLAIGHEPTIADLSAPNIRKVMRTLHNAGCRHHWVSKMRARLSSMWKHAQRIGAVNDYQAVPMLDTTGKQRYLESPPEEGTVRHFYMSRYRATLTEATRQDVDAAVKALDKFLGRYACLAEVTTELLDKFGKWLKRHGRSSCRVLRYQATVRHVINAWDPKRFKRMPANPADYMPEPAPGTLRHFLEEAYIPQRLLTARDEDITHYRRCIRYLTNHLERDIELRELSDALVAGHLKWLLDTRGFNATSVNNHRCHILAVWRFAAEVGEIDHLPRVRKLKETRHEPDSWLPDEIVKLLEATERFKPRRWKLPIPIGAFWRCTLLIEWWTGVRCKTLFSLRREDVDLDNNLLYFRPEAMKNKRGKKFHIGDDCVQAIRTIWEPPRELLLPWPFCSRHIYVHWRKLQQLAGLRHNGRGMSRLHKLRRSVATQAAVNGGIHCAVALMSHSTSSVTIARYIDPSRMPAMDSREFMPALDLGE